MVSDELKEKQYYPIVKRALEIEFGAKGYYFLDFVVLGNKRSIPDRFLMSPFLVGCQKKGILPIPDVIGLVSVRKDDPHKKLVIGEFKIKPTFKDIFQTKDYDELFNADYSYLIGGFPITKSRKNTIEYIKNRKDILKTKSGSSEIMIVFLQGSKEDPSLAVLGSEWGILPDHINRP